jgi:hypothetical protein
VDEWERVSTYYIIGDDINIESISVLFTPLLEYIPCGK